MLDRRVLITIDTISELFKDYLTEEDLPADAMPIKLMLKPTEAGKLGILMVSDSFPENAPPYLVKFDIKKVYSV